MRNGLNNSIDWVDCGGAENDEPKQDQVPAVSIVECVRAGAGSFTTAWALIHSSNSDKFTVMLHVLWRGVSKRAAK